MPYPQRVSFQQPPRWPRAIIALSAGLLLAGCLVEAPPEFELILTPPALHVDKAVPPTATPIQIEPDEPPISFSVPFYWDGAGGPLQARFYREGESGREQILDAIPVVDSQVQFPWPPPSEWAAGCHRVTLILTHASNYDTDLVHPRPIDPALTAVATWWVAVSTPLVDISLADCSGSGAAAGGS